MNWIYWLVIFLFPATIEYGNARDAALEVLHNGDYGDENEVVELAREQCASYDACGPDGSR